MLLHALAVAASALQGDEPQVRRGEEVDVARVVAEVRVLDGRGRPVRGLAAADFRLEVDGRPVPIESVQWVDARPHAPGAATGPGDGAEEAADVPRPLLLLLFQKDLTSTRGAGLLRMQRHARDFVRRLPARDRVAVASHDSRLRVWLDFTADREAVVRALSDSVLFGRAARADDEGKPSLRGGLDEHAARKAASPEAALAVLAAALEPLPGAKTLILFGWGMGELGSSGVRMRHDYGPALAALSRAGVSVFTLDLSGADYHSLEAGLQQVAEDTGGTYARTHLFPATAVRQLESALTGHYVLSFEPPALPRGEHRMRVRLAGRRATVLARSTYADPR